MADTNLLQVSEKKDIWLGKAWASSKSNKIDMSFLTCLVYQDDRTDIGYRPNWGLTNVFLKVNWLPDLWLTQNLLQVSEKKDIWLGKARASSKNNKTDMSYLTWLIYHDDRSDIGYRSNWGIISFVAHQICPQR